MMNGFPPPPRSPPRAMLASNRHQRQYDLELRTWDVIGPEPNRFLGDLPGVTGLLDLCPSPHLPHLFYFWRMTLNVGFLRGRLRSDLLLLVSSSTGVYFHRSPLLLTVSGQWIFRILVRQELTNVCDLLMEVFVVLHGSATYSRTDLGWV